jgi:EAL domain-containing protein (putative c-di-GMP-specific phosphodiesterase class I)
MQSPLLLRWQKKDPLLGQINKRAFISLADEENRNQSAERGKE